MNVVPWVASLTCHNSFIVLVLFVYIFLWCYSPQQAYGTSSEISRSHTITHTHSVCLLQMSDKPVAEAITYATLNKHKR